MPNLDASRNAAVTGGKISDIGATDNHFISSMLVLCVSNEPARGQMPAGDGVHFTASEISGLMLDLLLTLFIFSLFF